MSFAFLANHSQNWPSMHVIVHSLETENDNIWLSKICFLWCGERVLELLYGSQMDPC